MQVVTIYKYVRKDGGTTVSPKKPKGEYTEMSRLIADEGKLLTNGDIETSCVDVESVDGWQEVDEK